jgi:hypothetical protein
MAGRRQRFASAEVRRERVYAARSSFRVLTERDEEKVHLLLAVLAAVKLAGDIVIQMR